MGACHDDVVRIAASRLGDHVLGGCRLAQRLGLQPQHQARRRCELNAKALRDPGDWEIERERVTKRPGEISRDVVVDHDANCAGVEGVGCLDGECARRLAGRRAALDERDVAGREARPIGGRAAAVISGWGADGSSHVAVPGVAHDDVRQIRDGSRLDLLQDRRGDHLEPDEVEGLACHVVAGGLEDVDRVVDRLVIAGRARHAGAIVVVGDLLQGGLVLTDAFNGHAVQESAEGVVRPHVTLGR